MDLGCGYCLDSDCRGFAGFTDPKCPQHGKKKSVPTGYIARPQLVQELFDLQHEADVAPFDPEPPRGDYENFFSQARSRRPDDVRGDWDRHRQADAKIMHFGRERFFVLMEYVRLLETAVNKGMQRSAPQDMVRRR